MTAATSRTPTNVPALATPTPQATRTQAGPSGGDFAALLARQPAPGTAGAARLGDTQARLRATARAAQATAPQRPQPAPAAPDPATRTPQAKAPSAPTRPPQAASANAEKAGTADASARRDVDDADSSRKASADAAADPMDAETAETEDTSVQDGDKPGDTVLAAWLQWPGASRPEAAAPSDASDASETLGGDDATGAVGPAAGARAQPRSTDELQAQAATDAQAASTRADAQATPADGAFAAAMLGANESGLRADPARRTVSSVDASHGAAVAGLGATAQPAPPSAGAAAASPAIPLGTAPGQPDFAETVSMHLSQLAKEGRHEATLTLNPAELGSIAVRIALDGTQTQVDFSASSANTRDLLQAHLGDLARALQDAGLQMTGGGVRDQSFGQASDGRSGPSGRGRTVGVEAAPAAEAVRVRVPVAGAGRLDLFA